MRAAYLISVQKDYSVTHAQTPNICTHAHHAYTIHTTHMHICTTETQHTYITHTTHIPQLSPLA